MNTRLNCYQLRSQDVALYLWLRAVQPTGWRAWWERAARAIRRSA